MTDSPQILARLDPSHPRRVFGVGVVAAVGLITLWLGAIAPDGLGWRLLLLAIGVAALLAALALWRSTSVSLVLSDSGLHQSDGREIAAFDNISRVDRGMFAMKPSNGFLLYLSKGMPFGWAPGLWWRWGRRVGVGGVTQAASARTMADIIAIRLSGQG